MHFPFFTVLCASLAALTSAAPKQTCTDKTSVTSTSHKHTSTETSSKTTTKTSTTSSATATSALSSPFFYIHASPDTYLAANFDNALEKGSADLNNVQCAAEATAFFIDSLLVEDLGYVPQLAFNFTDSSTGTTETYLAYASAGGGPITFVTTNASQTIEELGDYPWVTAEINAISDGLSLGTPLDMYLDVERMCNGTAWLDNEFNVALHSGCTNVGFTVSPAPANKVNTDSPLFHIRDGASYVATYTADNGKVQLKKVSNVVHATEFFTVSVVVPGLDNPDYIGPQLAYSRTDPHSGKEVTYKAFVSELGGPIYFATNGEDFVVLAYTESTVCSGSLYLDVLEGEGEDPFPGTNYCEGVYELGSPFGVPCENVQLSVSGAS